MRPFYHTGDELFDLGDMGEHEIEFVAWLKHDVDSAGRSLTQVNIARAIVTVTNKDGAQQINITSIVNTDKRLRDKYESEILSAHQRANDWIDIA